MQTSSAGLRNVPHCPPARAARCREVGGYLREPRHSGPAQPMAPGQGCTVQQGRSAPGQSQRTAGGMSGSVLGTSPRAAVAGSHGPFSYVAALAWCPTVCRGTDDCGEHLPSTAACLAHPWLGEVLPAAPGKTPCQARGNTPCAPRVGLCGRLAARHTSSEATGGTYRLAMPFAGAEPPGRASSWGA